MSYAEVPEKPVQCRLVHNFRLIRTIWLIGHTGVNRPKNYLIPLWTRVFAGRNWRIAYIFL